jgi:hypothetical protein
MMTLDKMPEVGKKGCLCDGCLADCPRKKVQEIQEEREDMKHFVKISCEGAFPSGVDELGTYQISENMHTTLAGWLEDCVKSGEAKRV